MKKVPLHEIHTAAGGKMVPFAGYEMPVQYSGVVHETKAVRSSAGLFDASHMGEIWIEGDNAQTWLDSLTTNSLDPVVDQQARYTLLLNAQGGVIDDLIVYRLASTKWYMVCNASNRDAVWQTLTAAKADGITLTDVSDDTCLLALQGPKAVDIALHHLGLDEAPRRFRFVQPRPGWIMARTGYTGEDGVEFFVPNDDAAELWNALIAAGATACGLGARDVCRVEAGLPLYGHEMNLEIGPKAASLMFAVSMKTDFVGKAAVEASGGIKLLGLRSTGRGIPREGYAVKSNGTTIGTVTSGTFSPHLECGIAMVQVQDSFGPDQEVTFEARGKEHPAVLCSLPFVHQFK